MQALHRIRERQMKTRTAVVDQLRGLLAEYGIVIPQGVASGHSVSPLVRDRLRTPSKGLEGCTGGAARLVSSVLLRPSGTGRADPTRASPQPPARPATRAVTPDGECHGSRGAWHPACGATLSAHLT